MLVEAGAHVVVVEHDDRRTELEERAGRGPLQDTCRVARRAREHGRVQVERQDAHHNSGGGRQARVHRLPGLPKERANTVRAELTWTRVLLVKYICVRANADLNREVERAARQYGGARAACDGGGQTYYAGGVVDRKVPRASYTYSRTSN